jgi:hypothetical protein
VKQNLPATPFFSRSGVPTAAFCKLLELTSITEVDFESILGFTQQYWRVPNMQAKDIEEKDEHLASQAIPLFKQLGVIGVPKIEPADHSWLAIYGATYVAIHKRIAHMVSLWGNGIYWVNTAYLVSRRLLDEIKESPDVLTKPVEGGLPFSPNWRAPDVLPQTEAELPAFILSQISHHRRWRQDREHIVIAEDENGKPAGTDGTLRAFEAQCTPGGESLLVVSSQPHINRQGLAASRIVGNRFTNVVATGYDTPAEKVNVTRTLDDIAKFVYDIAQAAT